MIQPPLQGLLQVALQQDDFVIQLSYLVLQV